MMKHNKMVDIILPTYNGGKYLEELIDSIIQQSYTNWRIIIRDDGSNDNTKEIIKSKQQQEKDRIFVIEDELGNLGVLKNVLTLLKVAKGDYIMLCDQDDVWFDNKIEIMVKCIMKHENNEGDMPILAFSDSVVSDSNLRVINSSFWKYSDINVDKISLSNLLHRNIVQGAASIFNKELLLLVNQTNANLLDKTIYHDWWIASIASIFGKIYHIDYKLMFYRQHKSNVVGAQQSKKLVSLILKNDKPGIYRYMNTRYLEINAKMSKMLLSNYRKLIPDYYKRLLKFYSSPNINRKNFFKLKLWKEYSICSMIYIMLFGYKCWNS